MGKMDNTDQTPSPTSATGDDLDKSAVQHVYARWAPTYDATFGGLVSPYRRHVGTAVRDRGARDVLEIGVGTGMSLHHYPKGTKVTGVDMCPEMLQKARIRVDRGVDAEVELKLGDGECLAFPDDSFDLVVMLFVVSVTPDHHALLDEVARVLRPDGRVLIINHFAGVRGMGWVERLLAPMADRIGFRSQLPIDSVLNHRLLIADRVSHLRPIGFFSLVSMKHREHALP